MPEVYGEKTMKKLLPSMTMLFLIAMQLVGFTYYDAATEPQIATQREASEPVSISVSPQQESSVAVICEPVPPPFIPYNIPLSVELQEYLFSKCEEYSLDFELVLAIIECESSYRTEIVSKTNDHGLMQINKVNFDWLSEELGITDFLDAEQNIDAGTFILADLFSRQENTVKALMMYNCGPTGARRLWDKGVYSTQYTDKIMNAKAEITNQRRLQDETTNEIAAY